MAKGMVIWRDFAGASGKIKIYIIDGADSTELNEGDIVEFATNPNGVKEGDFVSATVLNRTGGYHGIWDTSTNPTVVNPTGNPPLPHNRGQIVVRKGTAWIMRNENPKDYVQCNLGTHEPGDGVGFDSAVPKVNITGDLTF